MCYVEKIGFKKIQESILLRRFSFVVNYTLFKTYERVRLIIDFIQPVLSCQKYVELDLHKKKNLCSRVLLPSDKFVRETLYLQIWSVTRDRHIDGSNWFPFFKFAFHFEDKNESYSVDSLILGSCKFIRKVQLVGF